MIEVFVEGNWDTSLENGKHITVYDKGTIYLVKKKRYSDLLTTLEDAGASYLCLEKFSHPDWNGLIVFEKDIPNNFKMRMKGSSKDLTSKVERIKQMVRDLRDDDSHVCASEQPEGGECTCGDYDAVIDMLDELLLKNSEDSNN